MINGSGTFDAIAARRAFGDELLDEFPFSAFVSKTITPEPRAGNPPPRLWETPAGLINSIGLPNKGLDGFLADDLPQLAELPVPLIVSVMGTSHDQFARLVEGVGGREEVAAIELNVSCPNVKSGLIVGESPEEAELAAGAAAAADRKAAAREANPERRRPGPGGRGGRADGGADAVSLINTLRAAALAPGTGEPWLGGGQRRPLRSGRQGGRAGAGRRGGAAVSVPVVGDGRHLDAVGTRPRCWERARGSLRSAPRASETRPPDRGSRRSWPESWQDLRLDGVFFTNPPKRGFRCPVAADILAAPMQAPVQSSTRRPREITGPADGGPSEGQRHPHRSGPS